MNDREQPTKKAWMEGAKLMFTWNKERQLREEKDERGRSMTSQQDTELEKILDVFFDLPYPDYNMGLLPDEEGYDVVQERRNYEEGYAREEIAKALTSWKDKEVMAAYRQGYNDNSRDCYCDSPGATEGVLAHRHLMDDGESHNIKPDVESLQSQGGKNE